MTISYFNKICFLGFFLVVINLKAQENVTVYLQPTVAFNYDVAPRYSHNFSLENRNYLIESGQNNLSIRHLHFAHFSNYQLRENQSIALGIQYRFREWFDDGSNELRITQQYNLRLKPMVIRYGHRLRAEQRITTATTVHRFRYRFTLDFPLQGEQLDTGEAYLVGNVESLLSVAKNEKPEYDQRFTLNLGWLLPHKTKIQVGLEYRAENYTNDQQHVLFFLSSLNFPFKCFKNLSLLISSAPKLAKCSVYT